MDTAYQVVPNWYMLMLGLLFATEITIICLLARRGCRKAPERKDEIIFGAFGWGVLALFTSVMLIMFSPPS